MNTNVPMSVYSKMLEVANSVLELSYPVIREKYADMPVCFLEYIEHGKKDNIIEVRFDEVKITLSCSFNKNNLCDASLLFFDDINEIVNFVSYLNDRYDYNYFLGCWTLPNCLLSIRVTRENTFIILYRDDVMEVYS